jgi:hypothetical protein
MHKSNFCLLSFSINVNELIEDFSPKEIEVSTPHKFVELISKEAKYESQSFHAMNQAYSIGKSIKLLRK